MNTWLSVFCFSFFNHAFEQHYLCKSRNAESEFDQFRATKTLRVLTDKIIKKKKRSKEKDFRKRKSNNSKIFKIFFRISFKLRYVSI